SDLNLEEEKLNYAAILEQNADDLIASDGFHIDVIAANKYIESSKIYLEFNDLKKMENGLFKALKNSKHGQFEKFGFAKIARPPRAKDENGIEIEPDPDNTDEKIREYLGIIRQGLNIN
ncbi:MAG: hypothetical protein ACXAD7_23545, partial [Candidatus Kariarchaeaceae archaeon]